MRKQISRFPWPSAALAIAMIAATNGAGAESGPTGPVITIADGSLAGSSHGEVDVFRGVPFAKPPVGDLRWRAPQPEQGWSGVRDATRNGNSCMQPPFPDSMAPIAAPMSEDCLYLNVWRPRGLAAGAKTPVIVWIHGGGFLTGGASSAVFDGTSFVRKGIILVGINYRLGRFGFFAHPALVRENKDGGLFGNYGYLDQIAALRWVRQNIGAFGGDPDNVTIFGESAGGASVQVLMTTPLARGLFKRAIVQSGGGRGNLMGARTVLEDRPNLASLQTVGLRFAQKMGIDGSDAAALVRLRALPAADVERDLDNRGLAEQYADFGGPSIDGRIVAAGPDVAYREGTQSNVALLIGATNADLALDPAPSKDLAFATFGDKAAEAQRIYDPQGTEETALVTQRVSSDRRWVEPARYVARLHSARGIPAYLYRFAYVADSMKSRWPHGAPHASEVPYAMDTVMTKYGFDLTDRDRAVAETMNSYWANFARNGDPNGPGLPPWPAYREQDDALMVFTASGEAVAQKDPWRARLDLIAAALPQP